MSRPTDYLKIEEGISGGLSVPSSSIRYLRLGAGLGSRPGLTDRNYPVRSNQGEPKSYHSPSANANKPGRWGRKPRSHGSFIPPILMPEMPVAGKDYSHACRVRRRQHFVVANRTAGLNHRSHTSLRQYFQRIRKGHESVRSRHTAGGG